MLLYSLILTKRETQTIRQLNIIISIKKITYYLFEWILCFLQIVDFNKKSNAFHELFSNSKNDIYLFCKCEFMSDILDKIF
jgi:hypothetical protein